MKVLFVHQKLWPYVERDLRILRERHQVQEVYYRGFSDLPGIYQGVRWCDLAFTWFGSLHAFFLVLLARRVKKPVVVVAGGWDVGQPPDGLMYQWHKRWCPRYVFSRADLTLTVSDFNHREALDNLDGHIKRVRRIYHGFETDRFTPSQSPGREALTLSVGSISTAYNPRKRYPVLLEAASLVPNTPFSLAGAWEDRSVEVLRRQAPANVRFLGEVSFEELLALYRRASVYIQIPQHEAFGCAVAEAMLCGCVPVVTPAGALPEVVGDCGIYTEPEPKAVADAVREALAQPELGMKARERICENFAFERRRDALLEAIEAVKGGSI